MLKARFLLIINYMRIKECHRAQITQSFIYVIIVNELSFTTIDLQSPWFYLEFSKVLMVVFFANSLKNIIEGELRL